MATIALYIGMLYAASWSPANEWCQKPQYTCSALTVCGQLMKSRIYLKLTDTLLLRVQALYLRGRTSHCAMKASFDLEFHRQCNRLCLKDPLRNRSYSYSVRLYYICYEDKSWVFQLLSKILLQSDETWRLAFGYEYTEGNFICVFNDSKDSPWWAISW